MTEIRSVVTDLKAIKRDSDGNTIKQIQGYAIMFNTLSVDLGGFVEVIKPTALDGVDLSDVKLIYAHENNSILARASAGNLTTKVDDTGLFFTANLPDTTLANDVYEDIAVGNLKGMSFGFTIPDGGDDWERQTDGTLLHTVNQIGVIGELTVTAYPAYQDTSVELKRSAEQQMKGTKTMAEDTTKPATDTEETPVAKDVDVQAINAQLTALTAKLAELEKAQQATPDSDDEEDVEAVTDDTRDDDVPDEGADDLDRDETDTEVEQRSAEPKEEEINMPQVITRDNVTEDEKEVRSYIDALKDVNKRDGVTTDAEGAILVPKQILDVQKTPQDPANLAHYVNRVAVANPTGTLPVLAKASARLVTKAELAKNPEVAKASIASVDYKVQTFIGQLPISAEMLADYPESQALVSQYLVDVKTATEEQQIGAVISTKFGKATASDLDGIKSAFNKLVNYGSDRVIILSVSAFNAIDSLKDGEGRYYVQPNVTAPSGSTLFGAPIVITADETLGNAGDASIFVGSLKHAIIEAVRLDGLATSWAQNDYFEQVLSVATRFDVQPADVNAGAFFTFAPATASAGK